MELCYTPLSGSTELLGAFERAVEKPDSRPYLQIALRDKVFQFKALCFGLSTAPQVFTRMFARVSEWAYKNGIRLLLYLDDWLMILGDWSFS